MTDTEQTPFAYEVPPILNVGHPGGPDGGGRSLADILIVLGRAILEMPEVHADYTRGRYLIVIDCDKVNASIEPIPRPERRA